MIINQTGGGKKPTGTKSITSNGTYDVTDYASADVNVPTTAPTYYLEKKKSGNKLIPGDHIINLNGITDIGTYVLAYAYFQNGSITGTIDLSPLVYITGGQAMTNAFYGCLSITGVDLSGLTAVSAYNALNSCFYGCTSLLSVDLSSLTTVNANSAMNSCFRGCNKLTSIDLSSLTTVSNDNCLSNCFYGCTQLASVDLSGLTSLSGNSSMGYCFNSCSNLKNISFSSLSTLNGHPFDECFTNSGLEYIDFPVLETITGQNAVYNSPFYKLTNGTTSALKTVKFQSLKTLLTPYAYAYCFYQSFVKSTSNTHIYFYALDTNSFGTATSQFNQMLYSSNGATVHFPKRIQSTIGSWSDVLSGFSGTNTTVLFDIVTTLVGADTNSYTRQEKDSTGSATAWTYNSTLYYTSGNTEPVVGDTIYSDAACTTAVTTVSSLS